MPCWTTSSRPRSPTSRSSSGACKLPSPVGHALAGLIVHTAVTRGIGPAGHVGLLAAVGAACAPDLDLVLNTLLGPHHHRGPSHSIGGAALAGLSAFFLARSRAGPGAGRIGLLVGLGWLSHVLLDWLGADSRAPFGVMALWPLRDAFFVAPFPLFMDVGRELTWRTFRHNLVAASWELSLLGPLLGLTRRSLRAAS